MGTGSDVPGAVTLLDAAVRQTGSHNALLLAPTTPGSPYFIVASARAVETPATVTFPPDGRLLRWLRVNDDVLRIPDAAGVHDDLSVDEQQSLRAGGFSACVPLVVDRHLVAVLGLVGPSPPTAVGLSRADALAREHAEAIRRSHQRALDDARVRATYRSHQLSLTGQFAAVVAHEMRNPLAAVRSMTQLVRDGQASKADQQRMLGEVIEEVDRIEQVLTDLLHVSRPHETQLRVFDAGNVVIDAASFVSPYARRQGVSIDASIGLGGRPVVGNARELRQVIINILLNACQASSPGATITLRDFAARQADGTRTVDLVVIDRGVGIAADELPRIYEPFYTTKANGTGLGLMFCRDVLQRFGGTITIASELGRGTTVTLRLPLSETDT